MANKIRELQANDLLKVEDLYRLIYPDNSELSKGIEELKWLLADPNNPDKLNGYIALDEKDEILGVIGYTINTYRFGNKKITGAIPMSWMIAPGNRGILGIQLLLKVMKLADFGFAIGGSKEARNSYKAVKLEHVGEAVIYTKVFKPLKFLISSNQPFLIKMAKSVYYLGKHSKKKKNAITLGNYDGRIPEIDEISNDLSDVVTDNRIQWLLRCPLVKAKAFILKNNNKELGVAVCYIKQCEHGVKRGRIVHIQYLNSNIDLYCDVISALEEFLLREGCCSVTVLGMNSSFKTALLHCHYKTLKNTKRLVYIRDPENNYSNILFSNWHITYYQSDKGYRSI
ncbi:MAG: hypothetical protein JW894_15990 [Bacteroidales bacterium]|nr:hypothetical protein [Bacteroidales bacterium]